MSRFKSANKQVFTTTVTSYFMMILYAVLLNIVGEILPSIINDFNLSLYQGGLLQTFFNIGGITALFCLLFFSDKLKKSKLVYFSFLLVSITLMITGLFTKSYLALGISFGILGSGTKVFDVSVNAFVNDINTKGREFYLQFLHVTFGIGAAMGPVYASYMISKHDWKTAMWILGIIYAVFLMVSIYTMLKPCKKIEVNHGSINKNSIKITTILKKPQVYILTFGAACFSGSYVGFVTWFPSYADTISLDFGLLSGLILSLFFLGYVVSRTIASVILTLKNAKFLIILTSFMGGLSFLLAFIIAESWAFFVFVILAGFFAGSTLPMIIFVACSEFPHNSGGVTTIIYLGISVSAMVIPVLMGFFGDKAGIAAAMPVTAYLLFVSAFFSLFLRRRAD